MRRVPQHVLRRLISPNARLQQSTAIDVLRCADSAAELITEHEPEGRHTVQNLTGDSDFLRMGGIDDRSSAFGPESRATTVNADDLSRDPVRVRGKQEGGECGDILGCAQPRQRMQPGDGGGRLLVG